MTGKLLGRLTVTLRMPDRRLVRIYDSDGSPTPLAEVVAMFAQDLGVDGAELDERRGCDD